MQDPRSVPSRDFSCGFVATTKQFRANTVIESHAHEGGTLSIPFRGQFLERFERAEITVSPRRALYKRPDFEHDNTIGRNGFDGVLVDKKGCAPDALIFSGVSITHDACKYHYVL